MRLSALRKISRTSKNCSRVSSTHARTRLGSGRSEAAVFTSASASASVVSALGSALLPALSRSRVWFQCAEFVARLGGSAGKWAAAVRTVFFAALTPPLTPPKRA